MPTSNTATNHNNHPQINPQQAIFSMLWGVWYGTLTRDVLYFGDKINTTIVSPDTVKWIYVFSSPVVFAVAAYFLTNLESAIQDIGSAITKPFLTGLNQFRDLFKRTIVYMFPILGFLLATYLLYQNNDKINPFFILFGAVFPFVWVVFEVVIEIKRSVE